VLHLATLAPGGWLQDFETDYNAYEEGRPAFNAMLRLLQDMTSKSGLVGDVGKKMKTAFERAGLVDVTIQRLKLPSGKLAENEEDRLTSTLSIKQTIRTLVEANRSKY
jgi:hypothetical protein